jgi:hypothetical protein
MGHVSLGLYVWGVDPGLARFCTATRPLDLDDPIRIVNQAVQTVLSGLSVAGSPRKEPDESVFLDRLFSARHAESLPHGIRAVKVGPGTVVTPLARDTLRRLGITIRLGGLAHEESSRGEWAFAIESEGGIVQALRRFLLDDPRSWLELEPSLEQISGWVVERSGRGALWVTGDGAMTVWKSCRVDGIRAASAAEPSELHRAIKGLGLNLLVVEPAGKSISWMRQLATAFRSAGAPRVPDFLMAGGQR